MYKLYNVKGWGSMAPHFVLEELGVPYQNVWMTPEQVHSESFRELSPLGFIPALGLPDGRTIIESMAIVAYLTEAHHDRKLAPELGTTDRAVYLSLLAFTAFNIYGNMNVAVFSSDYTRDAAANEQIRAHAEQSYHHAFDILDRRLKEEGPFLLGELFSAADLYLFTMTIWAKPSERALLERCTSIGRLAEHVRSRPKLEAALKSHGVMEVSG
jgi:glutathione S-transferase